MTEKSPPKSPKSNGKSSPRGKVKGATSADSTTTRKSVAKGAASSKRRPTKKPASGKAKPANAATKSNGNTKTATTAKAKAKQANKSANKLAKGAIEPTQEITTSQSLTRQSVPDSLGRTSMIPIIEYVLHGPVDRTFDQVVSEAGLEPEQGLLIWRILGFDDLSADGLMFNQTDVDALKAFKRAVDREMLTLEDMLEMIRAIAQTTSRLASWQSTIIGKRLEVMGVSVPDKNPNDEQLAQVIHSISGLRPILERLLVHIWRRQTVDNIVRSDRANAKSNEGSDIGTVAFADMVGFTRLSRDIEPDKLARLVERFEQVVTLIAAETGAKLMKTIGDEVLIMGAFAQEVAEFALSLQQFTESADEFPELRIGIATGPLISQMGDVFGETVNRASRLTAMAKPSSCYVDTETHEALLASGQYRFKSTRMRAIQGFSRMNAWELRRAKGK